MLAPILPLIARFVYRSRQSIKPWPLEKDRSCDSTLALGLREQCPYRLREQQTTGTGDPQSLHPPRRIQFAIGVVEVKVHGPLADE